MEEKKPLESQSLTHTSKELEGQVWAQIGTSSYDPSKKQASTDKPATTVENNAPIEDPVEAENGDTSTTEEPADDCNDSKADSTKSENETEAKKPNNGDITERKNRNILGDGFESKDKRSRSRSRSHERKRRSSPGRRNKPFTDYSTNSRNITDLRSRVFIGHLNTEVSTKEEVETLFKPYGKILGVNLQSGYGFVQFEDEESVKMAIKQVHGTKFKGIQLGVCFPHSVYKRNGSG